MSKRGNRKQITQLDPDPLDGSDDGEEQVCVELVLAVAQRI